MLSTAEVAAQRTPESCWDDILAQEKNARTGASATHPGCHLHDRSMFRQFGRQYKALRSGPQQQTEFALTHTTDLSIIRRHFSFER